MNTVIDTLLGHRSIRKFKTNPLPEGLLERLLSAGQAASSSSHVQAYSVIRISDRDIRAKLKILSGDQAYIEQCPEFLIFCADMKRNSEAAHSVGVQPILGMTEQLVTATVDTALMAQNVAIAAESEGLGIVFIGGIRNNPGPIGELLKLPKHVYTVFGMCLGYPDHNPGVKPRLPIAAILHNNTYDEAKANFLVTAFDQEMNEYYQTRSGGTKNSNWSQELRPIFTDKLRAHMRDYLIAQGFEMK